MTNIPRWGTIYPFVFLGLMFFAMVARSQEKTFSATFDNTPLEEALLEIENQTDHSIFFMKEWVADKEVTASLQNESVVSALDKILIDTDLNFYISENEQRIFLLQNVIIYDDLPNGFFRKQGDTTVVEETVTSTRMPRPVFLENEITQEMRKHPIAKVGKATPNNTRLSFVLRGKAFNASNGEVLPDLAIRVKGTNRLTVTDQEGNYSIELPYGYNVLSISAMGIEDADREVIMYNDGSLDLYLEEGVEELREVVVEADAAQNVEETITGSEQIESEESKNIPLVLGERDILQVAKALPGISSAGEGAAGINVRGGKTDQNLILLDDAVIYNPQHFFGIFQALNPFTTEKVDIYKGSMPVEYGGRISSVFDIRTKNGNVDEFSGEGSIGPVTGNLALEIPIKKEASSLVVGARGAYADWILRSLDEESLNNSEASFFDGILKYHHRINDNSEIKTTAYYSRDNFSITSDSLYHYSNGLGSVRWDHKYSEKTNGALFLGYSDYRFGIDYDGESNTDFELDYRISETQLKYKMRSVLSDAHTLDYGVTGKYYEVNPGSKEPNGPDSDVEEIRIAKEQAFEGAVFIGDQFKISERLLIDVGARYAFFAAMGPNTQRTYAQGQPKNESTAQDTVQYNSGEFIKTYGGPELRVSGRYFIRPDFSVKASFNNAYQFVHTLSNNTTVSPIDTWKLSDLNIRPQTAYQASLGLYKNFKDNEYELSVEGYYKGLDDVLDFKTGANLFLNENVETEVLQGEGKAYGVEFLLKKKRGKLNGWLGYTYSRSFYKFDSEFSEERINNGEFFPSNFDKPHDVSLISNYRITKRYSVSMNFVYQTGRPVTYPIGTFRFNNADFVFYSDRNKFRVPDYYRLDLGINIEGNHRKNKLAHSFWTISVYNVLGRNNPYSVFFVTEQGEVKALQSSIFAIPVPSITYNFKF